jgi:hypothetical protein
VGGKSAGVCHLVPPTEQHLNNPLTKEKEKKLFFFFFFLFGWTLRLFGGRWFLTHDGDQSWDDSRIFMTFTWAAMDVAACFYTTGQPKPKGKKHNKKTRN